MKVKLLIGLISSLIVTLLASILFIQESKPEQVVIGYHIVSLKHPYASRLAEDFKEEAQKRGYIPIVASGKNDRLQELKNIDYFIEQKVDAIFITALDGDFIVSAVKRANAAGIPVFAVDRKINGGDIVSTITSDNEDIGKKAAYFLVDSLTKKNKQPKGSIVEIKGNPNVSATIERSNGFKEVLANYPHIKVIAGGFGDYDPIVSRQVMLQILNETSDFDALFAHNDDILLGAYFAYQENNQVKQKPLMIGADGNPEVIQLINQGQLDATLIQQAEKIMSSTLNAFEDYQSRKSVPKELKIKATLYKRAHMPMSLRNN